MSWADSALAEDGSLGHASYVQQVLIDHKVTQVFIVGMALERAVVHTAVDAISMLPDATVYVVDDACRGFNPALTAEALKKVRDEYFIVRCLPFA